MRAALDSNILIDVLNGIPEAVIEISYYPVSYISAVTYAEVLVGCLLADKAMPFGPVHTNSQAVLFPKFLARANIRVVHTTRAIMYRAAEIRADGLLSSPRRQIKLSDAIIGATADVQGLTVVTRNPRDFGANKVRIPYQIDGTGNVINVLTPPA